MKNSGGWNGSSEPHPRLSAGVILFHARFDQSDSGIDHTPQIPLDTPRRPWLAAERIIESPRLRDMHSNRRFFRYLPPYPGAADWGAAVLDAGFGNVPSGSDYPLPGHPEDHQFSWNNGRQLGTYTFVYITAGAGRFESKVSGCIEIPAGSLFVVFPNTWHRYRPEPETGWDEYWVECEGALLETAVRQAKLSPSSPVLHVGHDDGLLRCFLDIAETIEQEAPGFEAIIAMRAVEIVARIRSLRLRADTAIESTATRLVRRTQVKMRENLSGSLDFEQHAGELGMSYSTFRRTFKDATGHPPGDYFIEMKMNRAKQLLLTEKSIQEVADLLGFDSVYYFSRLFKSRTGKSPSAFRCSAD